MNDEEPNSFLVGVFLKPQRRSICELHGIATNTQGCAERGLAGLEFAYGEEGAGKEIERTLQKKHYMDENTIEGICSKRTFMGGSFSVEKTKQF